MKFKVLNTKIFVILAISVFSFACKPKEMEDSNMYMNFLANPENGLVKEKVVAGIHYKIKYLPAEYLAYNGLKDKACNANEKSEAIESYDNSLTFLLNIGPASGQVFDITRLGVNNYEEFAERIELMAFEAQNWISITANEKEFKPTIVRLENLNAMENSRNLIVVFNTDKGGAKDLRTTDLCFTYSDEMFNTGTNKFIFKSDDLENVPVLKF